MFWFVERGDFSIMIAVEDDDEMRVQKVKNYGASGNIGTPPAQW